MTEPRTPEEWASASRQRRIEEEARPRCPECGHLVSMHHDDICYDEYCDDNDTDQACRCDWQPPVESAPPTGR